MDFLGKPTSYWIELQATVESQGFDRLILQNASLRAKVSFYEARLKEMIDFMDFQNGQDKPEAK
jgi:hypothetical protein